MTPIHDYMLRSLEVLRAESRYLMVVTDALEYTTEWDALKAIGADAIIPFGDGSRSILNGYRTALRELVSQEGGVGRHVALTNGLTFGPFCDLDKAAEILQGNVKVLSASYHAPKLDIRYDKLDLPDHIAYLDFAIIDGDFVRDESFIEFWNGVNITSNFEENLLGVLTDFTRFIEKQGFTFAFPFDPVKYETSEPQIYEAEKVVSEPMVLALPNSVFLIDPLLSDIYSLDQRKTFDVLRETQPLHYPSISKFLVQNLELRVMHCITDQVEILDENALNTRKKKWKFGTVGVFIHAFYATMMPEFWALLERLPDNYNLYITTATDENKTLIEAFLAEKGFASERSEVRVVEENRGRDMGSLFISFRDIILEDRHEVCLRLHSKRTPQVARQIGESFKAHLFDNLVYSNGYVRNLYDLLEREPDLGLVMPPTIHIGFGTMGHAWFNNRNPMLHLAQEMGIKVPFDSHTPLAPYGTMYWFRSKAMRRMFEWRWQWDQYNAEPMHVDGGLAHIQERLIPYVVQAAGYRAISIMNRYSAARNYAKLEFKLQRLASQIPTANIAEQYDYLSSLGRPRRRWWIEKLTALYQTQIMTRPQLHKVVRPFAKRTKQFLLR